MTISRWSFLGFLMFLCISSFFVGRSSSALGEVKGQHAGLIWIDVPEGWQWREDADSISLVSPGGRRTLRIDAQAQEGIDSEDAAKTLVEQAMAAKIQEIAFLNGKNVAKTERKIDGAFALQAGFLLPSDEGINQVTAIIFYAKKHLFSIYMEASRETLRLEMEEIADTIRFEPPKPPPAKETDAPNETSSEIEHRDVLIQ